jgi:hypothetical protein
MCFYGKIGCFPLVTYEHVVRISQNCLLGEQVIKPIISITREVIRDFMVNNVESPSLVLLINDTKLLMPL